MKTVDELIKIRVEGKRPEGMIFFGFISNLSIGMTAARRSWPKELSIPGIHMGMDGKLYIEDELWVPTQDDILADDWEVGD
jgi:hypothetical protein